MLHDKQPSLLTPMQRARGLGSAKDGTHHWWMQRLSALLLLPLCVFFACHVRDIAQADHARFLDFVTRPAVAVAGIAFIVAAFYHAALGVQVIIEDYVHGQGRKFALLALNKIIFFCLGVACLYAIIVINVSHLR